MNEKFVIVAFIDWMPEQARPGLEAGSGMTNGRVC